MTHPALPWLIGGSAAALALYLASQQSQANQPPISTAPQFDPTWEKKYIDPRILQASDLWARQGIATLAPGQLVQASDLKVKGQAPSVIYLSDHLESAKKAQAGQQAFTAKWGLKEVWLASELIEAFEKFPAAVKLLFRFPIANDAQARNMTAMEAGRVTIILDTVESVQYFSGVLLLAMIASFDPKKGTVNLDKPVVKNLMRLFSYHDWRVSEALTEYQLDTLNRFVGAPIDRWLRDTSGAPDTSEIDYFESTGPYWAPNEQNFTAGQWYRCVPNEYPSMNIPNSPTADSSYYMKKMDPKGDNFRTFYQRAHREEAAKLGIPLEQTVSLVHPWTKNVSSNITEGYFKDHLGDARPFAKKILENGRLWLFEYAALRMQNIMFASTMITGVSDLAGQALQALAGAVKGLLALAAGSPTAFADLGKAVMQAIGILIQFITESIVADQKNEALQRGVESHLNTLLSTFWGIQGVENYLSGYQLGLVQDERFQEGFLHAGYRFGASRSVSYFMRNWVLVHDQAVGGVCAYMHLPQIPLFMRGVPFAVITSATRDKLYAVESVYGYIIPPVLRNAWGGNPPSNLNIPPDAQGPVGVRIIEIDRGTSVVKVIHGPGAGGAAIPLKQYNPGFGLPGRIAKQTGGAGNEAVL